MVLAYGYRYRIDRFFVHQHDRRRNPSPSMALIRSAIVLGPRVKAGTLELLALADPR